LIPALDFRCKFYNCTILVVATSGRTDFSQYFGRLIPAPDFSWKFYNGTILAAATLGRTDFLGFLQIFCFLGMVDGC
jgi:hypothetical protein